MKKYEIKLIEKSSFVLDDRNRRDIMKKLEFIRRINMIMNLPYIKKDIKIKIKKVRGGTK